MSVQRHFRIIGQRLRSLFRREAMDAELKSELAFHLEQLVRENIAAGMTPEEARLAARRAFGNAALLEEHCRDHRRMGWLHDFCQDVQYGARMLRKSPAFTIVAITSLALGIGANTAIVAAMGHVFLGDLSFPEADRLAVIQTFFLESRQQTQNASVPDYFAWKERSRSFEAMGISLPQQRDLAPEEDGTPAEHIMGEAFSASLFATLGVQPAFGRVITEEDTRSENPARVVVLSHRLWLRRFRGDPGILNKDIPLNGQNMNVIGVMPPEFRYPGEAEFWIPLPLNSFQLQGSARYYLVTARLKPGAAVTGAQADLDAIAAQLAKDLPGANAGWGVRVRPLREFWFGWARGPLLTLEGAVILIMLIACANVATLLLARGAARRSELAVRMALGANRTRLIRQLLTEGMLLSLLGGSAGLLIAWSGLKVLPGITPPPGSLQLTRTSLNVTLLGINALCSILTGLVFGAAPALGGFSPGQAMRNAAVGRTPQRLRGILVVVQVGLALVLSIASGLLLNSSIRMTGAERNFDPHGILTFDFRLPLQAYLKNLGYYRGVSVMEVRPPSLTMQRIYQRLRALPGVESAAGISFAPVNSLVFPTMNFTIEGRPEPQTDAERGALNAAYFVITPNFFATMKTPFVRGRDIDARDTASSPWTAIVNETAASQFWPGENAIGKRITLDAALGEQPRQIIGVVRDVPLRYLSTSAEPVIYTSYLQQAERYRGPFANMFGQMVFLIRSSGDVLRMAAPARAAVAEIDRDRPISNIQAMEHFVEGSVRDHEKYALVLSVFAFTATLLAAIGIYGVTAYSVAQRTREIGVRLALGANVRDIAYLIGGRSLMLIASGLALGLAASVASTRLIASQLWKVSPTDPATVAGVSLFLALVAVSACLIPARRAIRVNPSETLRSE